MNDFFSTVIRWAVRIVLLAMGLVFALSLLFAAAAMAVVWWVRLLWARLTGRPVQAWVFRFDPRAGLNRFYRSDMGAAPRQPGGESAANERPGSSSEAGPQRESPLAASADWRDRRPQDVTDVEPKSPK